MMKNKNKGFTLVEIILTIALLSFISVVILRLYATAGQHNQIANEKSMASLIAANAIENADQYNLGSSNIIYYDQDWQECKLDKAKYLLVISLTTEFPDNPAVYEISAAVMNVSESKQQSRADALIDYTVIKCRDYQYLGN